MAAPSIRGVTAPVVGLSTTSPAGTQVGDLVLIFTLSRADTSGPSHTLQSGFTHILEDGETNASVFTLLSVARKVATSSGATAYQAYTRSGGSAPESWTACLVISTGTFNTTTPINTSAVTSSTVDGPPDPPSITTTAADCLIAVVGVWRLGIANPVVTAPSGYTEQFEMTDTESANTDLSVATKTLATATTENPGAFGTDTNAFEWIAATIAIAPLALVAKTGTDSGTGTDDATKAVTRTKTDTDSATGTDDATLEVIQNVTGSDSGAGLDDATVEKSVYKTGTDSGEATESTSLDILEGIADTDGGVATDVGSIVSTYNFLNPKEVRSHMSATIREAFPDQPDSTDGQSSIYERLSGTTGARQRVLLDVSRVVDLLRGGEVARAELNLPRPESFEGTLTVEPIDAEWSPETVTWATQPAVRAAEAVTYVVPAGTDDIVINVTAMVEASITAQDSAGQPWHGFMLSWGEDAEAKVYSSYADRDLQPFLDIDPSYIPDAPTHLRPSGGKAVSEVRPELAGEWRDPSGEQSMAGIHVIVATDEALESPVFDSGEVDHNVPRYDLNDPPSAGITLATSAAADDIIDTTAPHGLAEGDHVVFTSLTGGAGLSTGTIYYVIAANLASTTFQVSETEGGSAALFTTDITAGSTGPADLVTATPLYWAMRVKNDHGNWSDWSEVAEFQVVAKNALTITSPASSTVTSPVLQLTWTMTDQAAREIIVWKRQAASEPWIEHYRETRNPTTSLALTGPVPDTLLEEGWTYKGIVHGWDDVERDSMAGDPSYSEDSVEFTLDLP